MKQKVIKVGRSSLAVIIPADFTHAVGVKAGDGVKVHTDTAKGSVLLHFSGAIQLSFPTKDHTKNKK